MKFPPLEVMIQYGIYTVKELERFSKGLVPKKKNVIILNDCERCAFVFPGPTCTNCQSWWDTSSLKVTCPKGVWRPKVTVFVVRSGDSSNNSGESVWRGVINLTSFQAGYEESMEILWLNERPATVTATHFHAFSVGRLSRKWGYIGLHTMGRNGSIVKNLNIYHRL